MTHSNTFNLIEDLWTSNFLMDVGVSRTKVDARTYLLKQVAAYRPNVRVWVLCASQCSLVLVSRVLDDKSVLSWVPAPSTTSLSPNPSLPLPFCVRSAEAAGRERESAGLRQDWALQAPFL